jgi:hypothetical protein
VSGLALRVGGFGGVGSTGNADYGTQTGYDSVTQQAFGPGVTLPAATVGSALSPTDPVGAAFWIGVASVALLVVIRHSLPR